jgi:hypothetical protein
MFANPHALIKSRTGESKMPWRYWQNHKIYKLMVCVAAMGTRLKATPDPNTYVLAVLFKNEEGKEDATAITLTVGTLDLTKQQTKLFDPKKFARLPGKA